MGSTRELDRGHAPCGLASHAGSDFWCGATAMRFGLTAAFAMTALAAGLASLFSSSTHATLTGPPAGSAPTP